MRADSGKLWQVAGIVLLSVLTSAWVAVGVGYYMKTSVEAKALAGTPLEGSSISEGCLQQVTGDMNGLVGGQKDVALSFNTLNKRFDDDKTRLSLLLGAQKPGWSQVTDMQVLEVDGICHINYTAVMVWAEACDVVLKSKFPEIKNSVNATSGASLGSIGARQSVISMATAGGGCVTLRREFSDGVAGK